MNDSDTTNARGTNQFDCTLRQFERNRYFHGKLMTARDMQTEQQYHAGRMHTHSRYVTGAGIVCGLEVDVEAATDDSDSPTAVVEKGVAVDACGRQIVVEDSDRIDIPPSTAADGRVSVYIAYASCKKESVPVTGSEAACGEECEYNRFQQTYQVTFESAPPGVQKPVPVDRVELPTLDKVRAAGGDDQVAPDDGVLHELSRSYHEATNDDGRIRSCQSVIEGQTPTDDRLFLGSFTEQSDGSWVPTSDATERRPHVYTNDMLHAGLVDHVTDFGNPHDVVATVDEVAPVDGNVDLRSSDGSIVSEPVPDEGAVDLRVGSELDEYVRDKCLKYTIEAFHDVAETYADDSNDAADEVVDSAVETLLRARDALDAREFADRRAFAEAVLDLARVERRLLSILEEYGSELVTDRSFDDYQRAMERLLGLLPQSGSGRLPDELPAGFETPAELAVAQDQLCETAKWLERSTEETMTLPGGREVERRIIEDAIEPTGRVERSVDPSFERVPPTVESGETTSFVVNFGTASGVGIELEDEDGLVTFEANLQRGRDSVVPIQFDTGELDSSARRMTVAGDATLTVAGPEDRGALDAGEYTLTLRASDLSGDAVESATTVVRDVEEEPETVPPSLEDDLVSVAAGETASFEVNFGTVSSMGIEIEDDSGAVFEANLQGADSPVTLRFDTGELDSSGRRMTVVGNANLTDVRSPSRVGRDSLDAASYTVNLRTPDLNGGVVDTAALRVLEGVDVDAFDPENYVGRPAESVAGELYSRYDDVTVNYRPLSEVDAEPGTIVAATPPRGDDSTPTLTVAGTGFESVSGIGTTNRRNLFENGIFTAEEFSVANRASLENILSSNVDLDSVLESVNTEIDVP